MKKLLTLACLTLFAVGIASAQQAGQQLISFTSKTPFTIGNASLPAGNYMISTGDQDMGLFQCMNEAKGTSVMFEADASDTNSKGSSVTFLKYGDKMVLKSFSSGALQQSYFIPLSLPEKQAKKAGVKPTKVTSPAN